MTNIGNQTWQVNDPAQIYACQGDSYLDDPYEGELFTYFLQFFADLTPEEKEQLWVFKRPQLVRVDYDMGGVGPVTVQQGEPQETLPAASQWERGSR